MAATDALSHCRMCPQGCGVDRLAGELGVCGIGRHARVASFGPHLGEEAVLTGRGGPVTPGPSVGAGCSGSGTIFFSGCNLRCCFCQNHGISHSAVGPELSAGHLAGIMLRLQASGCCNINLVTPSHVVPQILEAAEVARDEGLRIPLVYNSGGYDTVETLRLLDGVVDIYMPDLKFHGAEGSTFLEAGDYGPVARNAVREMHRQVGDLEVRNGVAVRGLLVRHLVMPRSAADARSIFLFLADLSLRTYVNVMDQYRPAYRARGNERIGTATTTEEYLTALKAARSAGLTRIAD